MHDHEKAAPTVEAAGSEIDGVLRTGQEDLALSPLIIPGAARVVDVLAIMIGGVITSGIDGAAVELGYDVVGIVFIAFLYLVIGERGNLFTVSAVMRPMRYADDLALSVVTAFMFFLTVIFALETVDRYSRDWLLLFFFASLASIGVLRFISYRVMAMLGHRRIIDRTMMVLGSGEQSQRFLRCYREAKPLFVTVAGVYRGANEPDVGDTVEGMPIRGGIDDLLAAVRARRVDDVVVAMPWNADRAVAEAIEKLKELPVNVYLSKDLIGFELAFRPAVGSFSELPLFEVTTRPISGWASALKAIEDYAIATALILLLSPLLLMVAIAIKLDSPGPILFRQARLGFNNRAFHIYKFRSMYHEPDQGGPVRQATRGDARVTRVGRFIRATSIDELPQLFNVLDGTMSLVGPRPHAISHNEEYGRQIRGYFARHKVKPGITGWAQVNGLRGETDGIEKMAARIRHDVYYAENWSILFDIRIIVTTALVVLFQRSAY